VWQWLHYKVKVTMHDGTHEPLTDAVFLNMTAEEYAAIRNEVGDEKFIAGRYHDARDLFVRLSTAGEFVEFLTIPAYPLLDPL
jgi:malate synthase